MPLPSFLQRFLKRPAPPAPAAGAKPGKGKARAAAAEPASGAMGGVPSVVQAARVQARRRLVGALVLLVVGIVAFPLLFETQPRPVALDIPIQTPHGTVHAPAPVANTSPARQPLPPSVVVESPVDAPASAGAVAPVGAPASAPAPPAGWRRRRWRSNVNCRRPSLWPRPRCRRWPKRRRPPSLKPSGPSPRLPARRPPAPR